MTGKQKVDGPITIGLDIGIASVGWAVLGENRIIDLGVRCFDKAETAKKGESLNLERRTARLMHSPDCNSSGVREGATTLKQRTP